MKDSQRAKEILKKLRPIDDTFFEKMMEDSGVCEEILRVILEDPKLVVKEVLPQNSIKNLQGRSVRLDAFCILGNGRYCNVEVQKADNDNHLRRVRYHGACITVNITDPGEKFEKVPDVYVVYISQFDIFRKGKTIYHVASAIMETGEIIDNGLREIYVNTKINDGTDIAELMKCFEQTNVRNEKFPKLSHRVELFKENEKEAGAMCDLLEEYKNEGRTEGRTEERADLIQKMLLKGKTSEEIFELTDIPLEEIKEIAKGILVLH